MLLHNVERKRAAVSFQVAYIKEKRVGDGAKAGEEQSVHASFEALLSDIKRMVPIEGRLHPAIYKLAEHDRVNQSDYLHTLVVYLDNNCNAQKCGRLLYLHRNSMVYRVHRIEQIGGCDLSDPVDCSYLRLSLYLSGYEHVGLAPLRACAF